MPTKVSFITTVGNIQSGPAFLFLNILRPPYLMRPIFDGSNPPIYSDPPTPAAWAATTAYTVGETILDSNNNVQFCTTAGTSSGTEPTDWATAIGGTTTDGTVTWTMVAPAWIWAASTAVSYGQEIRDSNGNIQFCLTPGTTGGSAPTWSQVIGANTNDGTATWICLGPTLASGALEGDVTFQLGPKMLTVTADQYTGPIDKRIQDEMVKLTATLMELKMSLVQTAIQGTHEESGTDTNFPSNGQSYEEVRFGGSLITLKPSVCIAVPRPDFSNPCRYVIGWINAAVSESNPAFPFSLRKIGVYKADWDGLTVPSYPAGYQMGGFSRGL